MDETYINVKSEWKYLYRAFDKAGDTVDFLLRAHRDKAAARRFFEQTIERSGAPEKVTIYKSGSNVAALEAALEVGYAATARSAAEGSFSGMSVGKNGSPEV